MNLTSKDTAALSGRHGRAAQIAMRILVAMARAYGANALLDIELAHIDGCLYHGESGIDFAQALVDGGAQVVVPTTLNVGAIDLLHPEEFAGTAAQAARAQKLMALYQQMGCQPIWTCTPYQQPERPSFGQQIAWAESNAIVFANSVLGARTNRYGDFIDICAAITGRAPACGLHLPENRRGQLVFHLRHLPASLLREDVFYPVLGYHIGSQAANRIPIITGLPDEATEDQLKALGAAAASSGAVALFHAVGITPEAPTLEEALHGHLPEQEVDITLSELRQTLGRLSTTQDGPITAVALGSPHFSLAEFEALMPLITAAPPAPTVDFIVCTNRLALGALWQRGWLDQLRDLGVRVVVDSCVVVAPFVRGRSGPLMTNSGKFAHYTPGNIGQQVIFGSLRECVESAARGQVWREGIWG